MSTNTKRAITVVIVLLMILAACSGTDANATATAEPPTNNAVGALNLDIFDTSFQDALPETNQLILGTLRLDESQYALTADQAQQLLPLWQNLRTTMSNNTLVSEETLASYKQIANTMTSDQINAIRDMKLTQADLFEWTQANGVAFGGPGGGGGFAPRGTISPEAQATFQAGGGPGGGGPGGFVSPEIRATLQAGGEIPPELQSTLEASGFGGPGGGGFGGGPGFGGGVALGLIDQVIDMLTTLAAT